MTSVRNRWLSFTVTIGLIVMGALLLIFRGLSPAQQVVPPLRITSPTDGTIVAPGQSVTVVVIPGPNISPLGVFLVGREPIGFIAGKLAPPFTFTITLPRDTAPGKYPLRAYGTIPPEVQVKSPSITLDVEKPDPLTQLRVQPTLITFSFVGEQIPLTVAGTFADGTSFGLGESTKATYSSQDVAVAKVNKNGVVIAAGAGNTNVVVSYGAQSVSIPVSVPRTIPGDLNGDGEVDQDDLNIILDALNIQVIGSFDARDLNHDGIINMTDAKLLMALCTSHCDTINIPPDLTNARASLATLWPPDHRMEPVSVLGVSDPDADSFSIRIDAITQDEPTTGVGDGDPCPDATGVGSSIAQLRAERSGTGEGRVYTIYFSAKDSRGAESRGNVQVCVPHDQNGTCEFTGFHSKPALDSTVCHH